MRNVSTNDKAAMARNKAWHEPVHMIEKGEAAE